MKVAVLATDNREHYKDYDTPSPHFGTAPEALLQGFSMMPEDVEVHVVSCIRRRVGAPEKIGPNIYFHSLVVPKIGWVRTGYQGCIRATRRLLRTIKPDLVHAQGTERDCAMEAVFSGFPSVLTIHGNMRRVARLMRSKPFSYLWLAAKLEAFAIPQVDGVLCITRHTEQQVRGLAKRVWLLPNAVDASFFDVPRIPEAVPQLLCVGQVYEVKNQIALLRALDPLAGRHKFVLEVAGEANPKQPYAAQFLDMARTRPWCVNAGFVSRAALKEKLGKAALLIHASVEDNCPMAVLEAMAAGVPVVASNIGGLPDLVEEGVTGYFCDPARVESITSAVERALNDLARTAGMGETAKATARERFHPRVIAQGHLRIYRELLSSRPH